MNNGEVGRMPAINWQSTRGHRPDHQPKSGAARGVKGERSESRSDAGGALEAVSGTPTVKGRGDALLTTDEVARWLRVSPSTLCRWRHTGDGPRVLWLSKSVPRYRGEDVRRWLEEVAA